LSYKGKSILWIDGSKLTRRFHLAKLDVNKYARIGAEARAAELSAELAAIYRAFPGLRARGGRAAATDAGTAGETRARRRRKPMTAAQKKAVSIRMRKYWAGRRKAKE
jgi:hypothetical protein